MIVVYYGVNLSLSLPFCLYVLSSFSLPRPLPASLPLNLALCLASAGFFMPSAYAPIFIPLRCLSLSFCILNCPYSASFPFLALQLISSRPLLYLIFHFLPVFQSRRVPPALALPLLLLFRSLNLAPPSPSPSLWAILLCSRCSARRKYSLFAPPLDMAKEAICALLAILEHFFEAFSSIDLFFALAPFRPASSASPCFPPSRSFIDSNLFHLPPVRSSQHHPGLVPIPLGDIRPCCLHLPSFCRLVSPRSRTSLRLRLPVSIRPCQPRQPRPPLPAPRRAHQGRFHSPR